MARPANGARLTLATWLQPRPDRPATIPLPPDVTVRIGRVDGQAPADSAGVHTVGLNSREQAAVWKGKARPMWPAGIHAAQAAACPRLAEAPGSLEHDLSLTEASGEPAGRGLSHRVFHTGTLSTRRLAELTLTLTPTLTPTHTLIRHSEHKDLLSRRHAEISWRGGGGALLFRDGNPARPAPSCNGSSINDALVPLGGV
eukprot:scaffold68942_cov59-Phaeocystis_antarctica.AAC.1